MQGHLLNGSKTVLLNFGGKDMSIEKVMNYLLTEAKQSQKIAYLNVARFSRHPDIMKEFCEWIDTRAFPEKAISVEGYTAQVLNSTTYLSALGAYNFLIYLREKPEEAIEDLKAGLPRK